MRIASAAYPIDFFEHFEAYEAKLRNWVSAAAEEGAEVLVFPEYGAMELTSLMPEDTRNDYAAIASFMTEIAEDIWILHAGLAEQHQVTILGASMPYLDRQFDKPVNRAFLYHKTGDIDFQDKQILTRFEREDWDIGRGEALSVFEIDGVKTGVLICYDSEFPLLARQLVEAGVELLLVPSCTDTAHGFTRVKIGAMARALEGQCITVQSPTVGDADWSDAVDKNVGAAAIYAPPDIGFPTDGVITQSKLNHAGWTFADVDFEMIRRLRADGTVLNVAHWDEQYRE